MTTLGAPVSWPWNIGFVWNQKWMVNHHTPWNVGTFGIYQIYPLFWQNPWIEMVFILSSACRLACWCLSCHSGMQALSDPLREWGYELRDLRSEEGARSKLGWFFMCLYMYTYIYIPSFKNHIPAWKAPLWYWIYLFWVLCGEGLKLGEKDGKRTSKNPQNVRVSWYPPSWTLT